MGRDVSVVGGGGHDALGDLSLMVAVVVVIYCRRERLASTVGVGGRGLVFIVSSGRQWWVAVHPSAGRVPASPVGPHPRLWVGGESAGARREVLCPCPSPEAV